MSPDFILRHSNERNPRAKQGFLLKSSLILGEYQYCSWPLFIEAGIVQNWRLALYHFKGFISDEGI